MNSESSGERDGLALLLDEMAVRDARARCGDAATHGDSDAFRRCWADDATWVIGGPEEQPHEQRARGIEEIVELFRDLREEKQSFVHFAVQGPTELDGDVASARCLSHESARGPGARTGWMGLTSGG